MAAGDSNKAGIRLALLAAFPGEEIVTELRFHPVRRWRFDFAVPSRMLAVEYQGHGQAGKPKDGKAHFGRHGSLVGMTGDCEKSNAAQILGWRLLNFTALHFRDSSRKEHKLMTVIQTLQEWKLAKY